MKYTLGPTCTKMLSALQAAPTHALTATFSWEDRGFFGPKVKHYVLMIRQISELEAKQRFKYPVGNPYGIPETLVTLAFSGDLPKSIRDHLSPRQLQLGSTDPYRCRYGDYVPQGFMFELGRFGVRFGFEMRDETEWDAV